eukprot:m.180612 g.180612  ORF g.180612 m.180612 type:complete len:567 (+) comp32028_c0_seq1:235-1935(+)
MSTDGGKPNPPTTVAAKTSPTKNARFASLGSGSGRNVFSSMRARGSTASMLDSLGTLGGLGSVLGVEKPAIVIEIGTAYTKCGFSGESVPRYIMPSNVVINGTKVAVFDPEEARTTAELREILLMFLHDIMYKRLLVKTQDRRAVVCEGIAVPSVYRALVADILYRYFMFQSVMFAPNSVLSTLPMFLDSALVVDCGYTEATSIAVFDGVAAINTFAAVSAGGAEIHSQIRTKLKETYTADIVDALSEDVLEDIKVRGCIAGTLPKGEDGETIKLPSLRYPLRGRPTLVLGSDLRTAVIDPIFQGVGVDDMSIPRAILDTLIQCPLDSRKLMAKRILVVGGGCMLPGFKHRLCESLKELVKEKQYAPLVGIATVRTVLEVKLARAGMGEPEQSILTGTCDRLIDEIVTRCGSIQVSTFSTSVDGGSITFKIVTPDDVAEGLLENTKINIGQHSYAITNVKKEKQDYHTGIGEIFSFVKVDFPENILSWLGGSITGALQTLAERSLSKDNYLLDQTLPDWSDLRPRGSLAVPKAEAKLASHSRWKVVDRPRAWGCGSLKETRIRHLM